MSLAKSRRLAAHYAKQKAAHLDALKQPSQPSLPLKPPSVLELDVTPDYICRAHWVYLNGCRQTTCRLAMTGDTISVGYIEKWPVGKGGLADKSRPLIRAYGVVEIVPAGQPSELFGMRKGE